MLSVQLLLLLWQTGRGVERIVVGVWRLGCAFVCVVDRFVMLRGRKGVVGVITRVISFPCWEVVVEISLMSFFRGFFGIFPGWFVRQWLLIVC